MSQDQASHLKQVLPQLLSSKSLFLCNLPTTLLSEYALDSRLIYYIPLSPLPRNCFFFDFSFFLLLLCATTFSLISLFLLLAYAFSLVFIDFTLFSFLFPLSTYQRFFFVFCFSFLNFFLNNFSLIFLYFLLNKAFSLVFFSVYILASSKYFVF